MAENEFTREVTVTFLSCMVLLMSVVLYETEENAFGLRGMFFTFIAFIVSSSSFSGSCPLQYLTLYFVFCYLKSFQCCITCGLHQKKNKKKSCLCR